jgi:NSS family neurotransmitter:Na+ symporter
MVSLLEVPVAYAMRRFGVTRPLAGAAVGSLLFLLGIPASLGFGPWSGVSTAGGRGLLDAMDFAAVDILLPINGLLLAILLGWVWPRHEALQASEMRTSPAGRLWYFSLRYVIPAFLAAVIVTTVAQA